MRVKATIAYDGSNFNGFQRQKKTDNTVTTAIEDALNSLGIESKIVGSGRTDAKVHATGQVIHFDLPYYWQGQTLIRLKECINSKLEAIRFKTIDEVDNDFHSRFDAKERVYRYIFKIKQPNVFERKYVSFLNVSSLELLDNALPSLHR